MIGLNVLNTLPASEWVPSHVFTLLQNSIILCAFKHCQHIDNVNVFCQDTCTTTPHRLILAHGRGSNTDTNRVVLFDFKLLLLAFMYSNDAEHVGHIREVCQHHPHSIEPGWMVARECVLGGWDEPSMGHMHASRGENSGYSGSKENSTFTPSNRLHLLDPARSLKASCYNCH